MSEQRILVQVQFTYEEFRPFYEGRAKEVVAPSLDGRYIRFPASALRPFLTHNGISGVFALKFDKKNKLISTDRIK